jgi:hypothetical protein
MNNIASATSTAHSRRSASQASRTSARHEAAPPKATGAHPHPLASDQKPHRAENAGQRKSEVGQPTENSLTRQRREGNPSGAALMMSSSDLPGQKPVRSPSPDLSSIPRPAVTWSHSLLPAPGPSGLELHRSTTSAEDGDGQLTSAGSPAHASASLQMHQVVSVRSFWLHGPSRRARPHQEQS